MNSSERGSVERREGERERKDTGIRCMATDSCRGLLSLFRFTPDPVEERGLVKDEAV